MIDPIALLYYLCVSGLAPAACAVDGTLTGEQEGILSHLSIVYLENGHGNTSKTICFTGVNVQV